MSAYEMREDGLYCEGRKVSGNTNPLDAAWDQGMRQMVGLPPDQPHADPHTCPTCHHTYFVRRRVTFAGQQFGLLAEYVPSPDLGCYNPLCPLCVPEARKRP